MSTEWRSSELFEICTEQILLTYAYIDIQLYAARNQIKPNQTISIYFPRYKDTVKYRQFGFGCNMHKSLRIHTGMCTIPLWWLAIGDEIHVFWILTIFMHKMMKYNEVCTVHIVRCDGRTNEIGMISPCVTWTEVPLLLLFSGGSSRFNALSLLF